MNFDVPTEVDKEFILSHLSEEEIFNKYGVQVVNYPFQSPLRQDKHPTCSFYRSPKNDKLYLRDWAGHFWGDCFDLVMAIYNVRFYEALSIIAKDFMLIKQDGSVLERQPIKSDIIIEVRVEVSLAVQRREWNSYDIAFWKGRFGIKKKTLELFNVAPIQWAWMNGKIHYGYTEPEFPAYVYHFGAYNYKFYFPFRKKMRFLHNDAAILQGWDQLPETGRVLVITKSYKDVMKLYEYGIPAIAPMSETLVISVEILNELYKRFDVIAALYDHDETGIRSLKKYRDLGVLALWFPRNHPKDLTDFYEKYGDEDTKLLIQTVRDNIL